jgi:hypothetical protein
MSIVQEIEINTNKRIYPIIFMMVWLGLVSTIFPGKKIIDAGYVIFASAGIFVFARLLWELFGSVRVILTNDQLIIRKNVFSIPFYSSRYELEKIEMPHSVENERAETGQNIMGFVISDTNPNAIYFYYDHEAIKIGEGLEAFKAPTLVHEIKMQQAHARKEKASANS